MTQLSMNAILEQTSKLEKHEDKIQFLRDNYAKHFHEALAFGYDERIVWLLPETNPPFTPSAGEDWQMRLHQEVRAQKLYYFVQGGKGQNLSTLQREQMFIRLLESIDINDAHLVLELKNKKLPHGITRELIEEAYGKL